MKPEETQLDQNYQFSNWFTYIAPKGMLCHGCGQESYRYIQRPDGLMVCEDCAARTGWKRNDT